MRNSSQVYGPDELKILNQIVTAILEELPSRENLMDDPELRRRVGRQVIKYAADDLLNINLIRSAVLASFAN